jgi:arylsulfatase
MYRPLLLFCLFTLLSCGSPAPASPPETSPEERPNIVIILADDMGYSDLGCYGGEIATPNLDRLANNGLKFRHFYNAARCCPTRASLLTGRYPHAAGIGKMVSSRNSEPEPGPYQGYLREDVPTLAERLRDTGYRTYMSGKWHVGERPAHWPLQRGFERYFGLISGASSYYTIRTDQQRVRQMVLDSVPWTPPAEGFYATDAYSDFAVAVVNDHAERRDTSPFLLYLAYTAPHWPLHAPEETTAQYKGTYAAGWDSLRRARFDRQRQIGLIDERYELPPLEDDVPEWETTDPNLQWERRMEVYAAMLHRMDEGIGRLIEQLETSGELDNTLIMFLSDNGGCAEEITGRNLDLPGSTIGLPGSYVAYRKPWSQLSNVPFRKYKQWTDEGGIATPLIVHWPAGIAERGQWVDHYAHVIDLFPTVVAVAGADAGAELAGENVFATVRTDAGRQDRPLFWEHFGRAAVRRGRWKLVRHDPEQKWMLFNMVEDPTELNDVAAEHPGVVDELDRLYKDWATGVGV